MNVKEGKKNTFENDTEEMYVHEREHENEVNKRSNVMPQ